MATITDKTSELLQAVLAANDERKDQALRVLRGEISEVGKQKSEVRGPLLLGMSAGARFLGVSRATLWRVVRAGKIEKVELFPGSMRVRREDLEGLAGGRDQRTEVRSQTAEAGDQKADTEGAERGMRAQRGNSGRSGGRAVGGAQGTARPTLQPAALAREADGRGEA